MKLHKDDKVIVLAGKDKGKTGKIVAVLPKTGQIVVEGINVAKRHTKPSTKVPRGGILDITRPMSAGKVMVLDPVSGKPARIGYKLTKDGKKERIFKLSAPAQKNAAPKKAKEAKLEAEVAEAKPAKKAKAKADK